MSTHPLGGWEWGEFVFLIEGGMSGDERKQVLSCHDDEKEHAGG